jgi:hypothetical protein
MYYILLVFLFLIQLIINYFQVTAKNHPSRCTRDSYNQQNNTLILIGWLLVSIEKHCSLLHLNLYIIFVMLHTYSEILLLLPVCYMSLMAFLRVCLYLRFL